MDLDQLTVAYNGDAEATSFVWNLLEVAAICDSVEKGEETPRFVVEKLMWIALVVLPNNNFYRRHLDRLQPLIQSALLSFFQPKFGDLTPERHALCEIAKYVAFITGGPEHGRAQIAFIQAEFEAI